MKVKIKDVKKLEDVINNSIADVAIGVDGLIGETFPVIDIGAVQLQIKVTRYDEDVLENAPCEDLEGVFELIDDERGPVVVLNAIPYEFDDYEEVKSKVDNIFSTSEKVSIVFRKQNGDQREMVATTDLNNIPERNHPKGGSTRKQNPDQKNVFDIEAEGWRSFRYDSLIAISF